MKFIFGCIAFLMLLLLVAGCTQPAAPQATPVPTTAPTTAEPVTTTTVVPTTIVPATPGPTDTIQSNWAVTVQVQSNGQAINPQVIYTFNGGMGMNLIPEIDVMLIRSDGTVEIGNMTQPLSIGQTVSLPGTTGNNDRAEVWVITPQGDRVKIVDMYVPFRSYH